MSNLSLFPKIPTKQQIEDWALPYFLSGAVFLGGVLSFVNFIPLSEPLSIGLFALATNFVVDPGNVAYIPIIMASLVSYFTSSVLQVPAWSSVTVSALTPYVYLMSKKK